MQYSDPEATMIADIIGDRPRHETAGYAIETHDHAVWAIGELSALEYQRNAVDLTYRHMMEKLNAWRAGQIEPIDERVDAIMHGLRPWAMDRLAGGKSKTLKLPNGKVAMRKLPDKIVIDDEQEAMEWARVNAPGAIVVKESLAKSKLKDDVIAGAVPGAHLEIGEERVYVEADNG